MRHRSAPSDAPSVLRVRHFSTIMWDAFQLTDIQPRPDDRIQRLPRRNRVAYDRRRGRRAAVRTGAAWQALGSGLNGHVAAIAVAGSDVYVGGFFTESGSGGPLAHVASWDSKQGSADASRTDTYTIPSGSRSSSGTPRTPPAASESVSKGGLDGMAWKWVLTTWRLTWRIERARH